MKKNVLFLRSVDERENVKRFILLRVLRNTGDAGLSRLGFSRTQFLILVALESLLKKRKSSHSMEHLEWNYVTNALHMGNSVLHYLE